MRFPAVWLVTLFLLVGCRDDHREASTPPWEGGRLLGLLPADCRVGVSRVKGGDTSRLRGLTDLFGQPQLVTFLALPPPFALGRRQAGWVGLFPEQTIAAVERLVGEKGFAQPTTTRLHAWAVGADAAGIVAALVKAVAGAEKRGCICGKRIWPGLARAAAAEHGAFALWLDLTDLDRMISSQVGSRLPADRLAELFNLGAFAGVLLRGGEAGGFWGGIWIWPDRVGLPRLFLPEQGGLLPAQAPPPGVTFCWLTDPTGLWGLLEGVRTMPGVAAKMFAKGLITFALTTGLNPKNDVIDALAGPFVLNYHEEEMTIGLTLHPDPISRKLKDATAAEGGLTKALELFSLPGEVEVSGNAIFLYSGKKHRPSLQPPRRDRASTVIGRLRLTPGALRESSPPVTVTCHRAPFGIVLRGTKN